MGRKKKQVKPIITETIEEFQKRGGGILIVPTMEPCRRLLYSNGHFGPKASKSGKRRTKGAYK